MAGIGQPFSRHLVWSSLDANAKADLLLEDISDLSDRLREAQWILTQNSNGVSSLRQQISQLSDSMNNLSDRVAALGR